MNCFVCKNKIELGQMLKCTGCKNGFHYSCLNITSAYYLEKQSQLKSNYKCDSCANITQRVRVTDDTPVRGMSTRSGLEKQESKTSSDNKVSMEGIMLAVQNAIQNNMSSFEEMIESIVATNIKALETKLICEFKTTVSKLELENTQLRQDLDIASRKCVSLEETIKALKVERRNIVQQQETQSRTNISATVSASRASPLAPTAAATTTAPPPRAAAPRAASPRATSPLQPSLAPCDITYASVARNTAETEAYDSWTEVKRKNPIRRGGNSLVMSIKGIERKKYLHVWRLDKATTEDNLLEYIKKLLGNDTEITIQKLKPKTERDYASFKIGVIESDFNKLCNSDVWPLNTEFSEWIFFRRQTPISTYAQTKM